MEMVKSEKSKINSKLSASFSGANNNDDLVRKNKELTMDINILKRLVYMLNVELELRNFDFASVENERMVVQKNETNPFAWKHEDIKMVEPLLQAFQQTKEEKDNLLFTYKQSFDEFSARCKDVVVENDSLREQLCEAKMKADSTYSEWSKLHREFLLLKEHNELLIRQTKLFQNKIRSIEQTYKSVLKELEDDKQNIKEKYETTNAELLLLKGRFSVLSQINEKFKSKTENENESEFWSTVIKEIKNISTELKLNYSKDLETLKQRISLLETQKSDLTVKFATVSSERDYLQGYISSIECESRKLNSKYQEVEEELESIRKDHTNAKVQTAKCMSFIRELVSVHNTLLSGIAASSNTDAM